jgi:hypothetical protein
MRPNILSASFDDQYLIDIRERYFFVKQNITSTVLENVSYRKLFDLNPGNLT